jgi:hypothetical protein
MISNLDKWLPNHFQANLPNSRKRDGILRHYDSFANKFAAEPMIGKGKSGPGPLF